MFEALEAQNQEKVVLENLPLAARMRPETLDDFVGQEQVLGKGSWVRTMIEADALTSIIFYGPPGVGKTTLARVISKTTNADFESVSALSGSVSDLRRVISAAKERLRATGGKTILFVDEIHRFSKSQQDSLLGAVEDRTIILIGATTENPYFEVNSALLSRSKVVLLEKLKDKDVETILKNAILSEKGLNAEFSLCEDARCEIVRICDGDARVALNLLESASLIAKHECRDEIEKRDVLMVAPERVLKYDKSGDMHYDVISAFIKSMRGSDPDAALFWMARMLEAGEDPKFIARRILICASEDVGNADPRALLVADAAFHAVEVIGLPECRINLAQAAMYVALAPKSNAAERCLDAAYGAVARTESIEVPDHLRDRHRPGAENYPDYKYPHDFGGWVEQDYLPDGVNAGDIFSPSGVGWEEERARAVKQLKEKNN